MPGNTIFSSQYVYQNNIEEGSLPAVEIHDIFVKNTNHRGFLIYLSILAIVSHIGYLFLTKEEMSGTWQVLAFVFALLLVAAQKFNQVKKERVIILPSFGIQLETHYRSGRIRRRFVPIAKILRPVLNECVTPVTCYWSLSLICHSEDVLMLVFKELQPPAKLLVPIWKALCAAVSCTKPEI